MRLAGGVGVLGYSADEADQEQQDDRADRGRDNLTTNVAAGEDASARQKPARKNRADDADHNVADKAKTVALDDDAGEETGNRADDE